MKQCNKSQTFLNILEETLLKYFNYSPRCDKYVNALTRKYHLMDYIKSEFYPLCAEYLKAIEGTE